MKTLLTIAQQNEFLSNNYAIQTIEHKWSSRGYGNAKILDCNDSILAKAIGCGYDRFGTVIGQFIEVTFQDELLKLAKRFCKEGKRGATRKGSKEFYGMFYNAKTREASLDGGCGYQSMCKVLNAIGFELKTVSRKCFSNHGFEMLNINPVSAHNKKYVLKGIK